MLALILENAATTRRGAAAFGHTFAWVAGLSAVAIIPAPALPGRPWRHQPA